MTPAEIVLAFHEAAQRRDESGWDLIADELVQHAAGPQGRQGLRQTLATLEHDLDGPTTVIHRVVAQDDLVVVQLTMHGRHVDSTNAVTRGAASDRSRGRLGLHPHLASREWIDRRTLGLPR